MRHVRSSVVLGSLAFLVLILLPALASAQSSFTGIVKDTSGAILPGVTVEAASPVLIEKVRAVSTDAQGRYTLVNLRPGTYSLTFALPGFTTLVRDAIELSSNFTMTLDADLRVGALEESVTVSGDSPIVDVQNAQRTQVLTRDVIDALPITRNSQSIASVVPGVKLSRPDVGGSQMMEQVAQSTHGSLVKDITMQVDGMMVNSSMNDYGIQAYNDDAMNAEVSVQTSAVPVEVSAGGIRINMIPKDGGNRFSGAGYFGGTPESWQSSNIDDDLRAKGIRAPNGIKHVQDFNVSEGGPIIKDKLWFFGSARHISVDEKVTNAFYPDGSPAIVDQYVRSALVRLTYQMTPKNKLSSYFQKIYKFKGHELTTGTDVVTASQIRDPKHAQYYVGQVKYTSTITPKLLFEGGYSTNIERLSQRYQPGIEQTPFTPAWYAGAAKQDVVLTTLTNAALSQSANLPNNYAVSSQLTYVKGIHNIKTGFQWVFGRVGYKYIANADLVQQYRSGVPDTVLVYNTPTEYYTDVSQNQGFYVSDSVSFRRLTLNGGVRLEHLNTKVADVEVGAGRFMPARSYGQGDIVDADGKQLDALPNWWNIAPRVNATYDLFGDAKTALKVSANKYVVSWAGGFAQRYNPMTFASDSRLWRDTNGDDIAQDSEIGPSNNSNFGIRQSRFPSADLSREYNIEYSAGVQRQLLPGVSVLGAWFRRTYKNSEGLRNVLVSPSDYTAFTFASPLDGTPVTMYNLNSAKQGQVKLVDVNSDVNHRTYDGFEVSFNARLPHGANVFGGWTSDRLVRVSCDTNDPNQLRFCDERDYGIPYRHDFKFAGNYPLPWGFQISGIFMSYAGNANNTNYTGVNNTNPDGSLAPFLRTNYLVPAALYPNGQRTQALTVNLSEPGTSYLKRWNQLDLEGKRVFRIKRAQFTGQVSVYNVLNSNVVLSQNQNYGAALGQPLTLLQARIVRAALQYKF
jgi:hypothetical protein